MKSLLFLYNPCSGTNAIKNQLSGIVEMYCQKGYVPVVLATQYAGHARELLEQYGDRFAHIVVSGGDGTLNECVNALMKRREDERPTLGYIPTGSTNDFAKSIGISRNVRKATEQSISGKVFAADIGTFQERYFTYVAAFGAFTEVTYMTPQETKNLLGHQAYLLEAVKKLSGIKPQKARVRYNNTEIEDEFLLGIVSNSNSIAGIRDLAGRNVSLDDGLLEVTLIRNPQNPVYYSDIIFALLSQNPSEYVIRAKTSKISLVTQQPVDWVLDGEFGGRLSEVRIGVLPKALKILV